MEGNFKLKAYYRERDYSKLCLGNLLYSESKLLT